MAAAPTIPVIAVGGGGVPANMIWLRDFKATGRVVGNETGGLIDPATLIAWQNTPNNLADNGIVFVDCRKITAPGQVFNPATEDFATTAEAKQLPGHVLHCQFDNNTVIAANPAINIAAPWFLAANNPHVRQVVFYCVAGQWRSPKLAIWYIQQAAANNGIANQSVCLLSGGFGTWRRQIPVPAASDWA